MGASGLTRGQQVKKQKRWKTPMGRKKPTLRVSISQPIRSGEELSQTKKTTTRPLRKGEEKGVRETRNGELGGLFTGVFQGDKRIAPQRMTVRFCQG